MAATMADAPNPTFAFWVKRLSEVSTQLVMAHREYAECQSAVIEAKARAYEDSNASSHGERQGIATASVSVLEIEKVKVKGRVDSLTEERDLLKFLIEWVGE